MRIERAESRLCAAFAEIERRTGGDAFVAPVGGTVAVRAGPGSPFNKVVGLGLFGRLDEAALGSVEEESRRRGAPLQVELSSLADPEVGKLLTRRGYVLLNFENVLALPLGAGGLEEARRRAQRAAANGITVEALAQEDLSAWIDVMIRAVAHPDVFDGPPSHESFRSDVLERALRHCGEVESRYAARRGGRLAGGATLRMDGGIAQLTGAATLPEERRKGVQSALLLSRLEDAARQGCDLAVVTAQPGSKSQENAQRAGFVLLYTRAILVRPAASPAAG